MCAADETPSLQLLARCVADETPSLQLLACCVADETPSLQLLACCVADETLSLQLVTCHVVDETPSSLLDVADCQLKSSTMRSIFSHPLLDKPVSELYQRSLDALRIGLDKASLSLAATVLTVKLPVANIFGARVRQPCTVTE